MGGKDGTYKAKRTKGSLGDHNNGEYHRQVQFLALAIAYPCGLVLTFAIGFFRAEGFLADLDPRDLPAALLLSGGLGYFIAWKRYS